MPAKILVVDDEPDLEPLIRQKFRQRIRQRELQFVFARNGVDALVKLQAEPDIDMVLTDINMPEMDGLALLGQLAELQHPTLKTVIVSAYGDMERIRAAMNRGAFDFLTKPINLQDLEITINKTLHHVQQMKQAVKQERLVQEAQAQLSRLLALREHERRLTQFLEAMPVGVAVLDASGKSYFANRTARQLLNRDAIPDAVPEEMAEVYQSYVAGSDRPYPWEQLPVVRALRGESSRVDDLEFHQGDKIIPIEAWGTPIFDERGNVAYALVTFQDITQRKRAEAERIQFTQQLEQKNAALQKMDRLKDEFLANTSHELRTPLNGIIGIAESLIDGAAGLLTDKQTTNLSMIVSSGKRLAGLVNDILDFSKLKNQEIELRRSPVDFQQVTEIVLALSRPLLAGKQVALKNEIPEDLPAVEGDENRLQQIMYNLVGNAVKFTKSGSIAVSAAVRGAMVEVTVADTGIGIPPDKLVDIFKSFEQADASTSREYGGTGLGLSITKQLVELHGGTIRVESELGLGSQFIFTLSVSAASPVRSTRRVRSTPETPQQISRMQESLAIPAIATSRILRPNGEFTILAVDDEPINLQVVTNYLSLENYDVIPAVNGKEALDMIGNGFRPDLILLDVMMPKMSGYQVCQKIRQQFPASEMPVVMLTAKDRVSDLVEGLGVGANDYLTKPVSRNELLARIKTHIELSKINIAYGRFVPREFLRFLERDSIVDVRLGDQVLKEMSILFADIRSFTTLSEGMSPEENFNFLNSYLSRVGPVIRNRRGFIDKYIGDAVMALFPESADDALQAAISIQKEVSIYNGCQQNSGYRAIAIGIGLHTGSLMLGTIGEEQRMESTVISDAVNLASRLEELTKVYGASILISGATLLSIEEPANYSYRFIDKVRVKGKKNWVSVFEIFDADPLPLRTLKMQTKTLFEKGIVLYQHQKIAEAYQLFQELIQNNVRDRVVSVYLERCQQSIEANA